MCLQHSGSPQYKGGVALIGSADSDLGLVQDGTNILGNVCSIAWVNLKEQRTEPVLDILSALAERAGDVRDNVQTVLLLENLVEEGTRLFEVVVGV